MESKVVVIGQGYVGLPLALAAAEAGYKVIGIDKNEELVASIRSGRSTLSDISDDFLKSQLDRYHITTDFKAAKEADVAILCLPTPLDEKRDPDHSIVLEGAHSLAPHLSPNTLVINESTVSPGFTREHLVPLFTGHHVVYSPERTDPANKIWNIRNTPKLIAGIDEKANQRAVSFYSKFIKAVSVYDSIEVVELAKLLENSFRLINIAFINEFADFCLTMNVDVQKVIAAATTKPYGFMPFYPSAGIGGHCIPVDPIFLASTAKQLGSTMPLIDLAVSQNSDRPAIFVRAAQRMLGELGGKRIIVIGVAYKPNTSDTRETPAKLLIELLRKGGAVVSWHDELVKIWEGESSSEITSDYDLAILVNPHDETSLSGLGIIPVIDTQAKQNLISN